MIPWFHGGIKEIAHVNELGGRILKRRSIPKRTFLGYNGAMKLLQTLTDRDPIELRIIAQNQGLLLDEAGDAGSLAEMLAQSMLAPEHVQEVWADLSPQARIALASLANEQDGMPLASFERRFGEIRRPGPGRLQKDQPWKAPLGPGEVLWWLGWISMHFRTVRQASVAYVSLPEELRALLPLETVTLPQRPFPRPISPPNEVEDWGQLLLDDLGTLLAYVQNRSVKLRVDGRWRYEDLKALLPRLRLAARRKQPLEAGGPLHLLFFAARKLGLLVQRQGYQRFGQALRPWLEQSRGAQMASLFRAWREADAEEWNDLCLMPEVRCQPGAWSNDPQLAREVLLDQLERAEPGQWYDLDDLVAMMYENMPDFQRLDGQYDTWYIQNAAGEFLTGFEHWPAVEGALIRYLWRGPLFWLGAVELDQSGHVWQLTPQGQGFLSGEVPSQPPNGPILTIERDFTLILAPHIGLWDRLRVALFAFWQASEPEYRYQITQRGLKRAARRGVSAQRVLAFLERASDGQVPGNVRRALERFAS